MAQTEFDRQAEVTRLLLEGISSTHVSPAACYPSCPPTPGPPLNSSTRRQAVNLDLRTGGEGQCLSPWSSGRSFSFGPSAGGWGALPRPRDQVAWGRGLSLIGPGLGRGVWWARTPPTISAALHPGR